jgi:hypothetical protein
MNPEEHVTEYCPKCGAHPPDSYPTSWGGNGNNYLEVHYFCNKCGTRYKIVTENKKSTKSIIAEQGQPK